MLKINENILTIPYNISSFGDGNDLSSGQQSSQLLQNPRVHCRDHKARYLSLSSATWNKSTPCSFRNIFKWFPLLRLYIQIPPFLRDHFLKVSYLILIFLLLVHVTYTANKCTYRYQIKIRVYGTGGHKRNSYKILVRNPKGLREIERATYREKNNIKMYIR
jgi:hypothetical protein